MFAFFPILLAVDLFFQIRTFLDPKFFAPLPPNMILFSLLLISTAPASPVDPPPRGLFPQAVPKTRFSSKNRTVPPSFRFPLISSSTFTRCPLMDCYLLLEDDDSSPHSAGGNLPFIFPPLPFFARSLALTALSLRLPTSSLDKEVTASSFLQSSLTFFGRFTLVIGLCNSGTLVTPFPGFSPFFPMALLLQSLGKTSPDIIEYFGQPAETLSPPFGTSQLFSIFLDTRSLFTPPL